MRVERPSEFPDELRVDSLLALFRPVVLFVLSRVVFSRVVLTLVELSLVVRSFGRVVGRAVGVLLLTLFSAALLL